MNREIFEYIQLTTNGLVRIKKSRPKTAKYWEQKAYDITVSIHETKKEIYSLIKSVGCLLSSPKSKFICAFYVKDGRFISSSRKEIIELGNYNEIVWKKFLNLERILSKQLKLQSIYQDLTFKYLNHLLPDCGDANNFCIVATQAVVIINKRNHYLRINFDDYVYKWEMLWEFQQPDSIKINLDE